METINAKCSDEDSFKYSILISLHYYDLNSHKERINTLNRYINNYNFSNNSYDTFETDNQSIYFHEYHENGRLIHNPINNALKNAYIVKINNNRYHALKPIKDKYKKLEELLKQFTHKEITNFILRKAIS